MTCLIKTTSNFVGSVYECRMVLTIILTNFNTNITTIRDKLCLMLYNILTTMNIIRLVYYKIWISERSAIITIPQIGIQNIIYLS